MGLRITPLNPLAAQRSALIQRASSQRRLDGLSLNQSIRLLSDGQTGLAISAARRARINELSETASNATRATALAQTADDALAAIEAELGTIRRLVFEVGNRSVLGESALQQVQEEIDEATGRITVITIDTRLFGIGLFNGSFQDEQFRIGSDDLAVLSLPNLAALNLAVVSQDGEDAFPLIDADLGRISRARDDLGIFRADVLVAAFRAVEDDPDVIEAFEELLRELDFTRESTESLMAEILLRINQQLEGLSVIGTGNVLDLVA